MSCQQDDGHIELGRLSRVRIWPERIQGTSCPGEDDYSHRNRIYSCCCFSPRSVSLSKSFGRNITEELGWLAVWMRHAVGVFMAKGCGRMELGARSRDGNTSFLCWGLAEAPGERSGMKKLSAMMGAVPRRDGGRG